MGCSNTTTTGTQGPFMVNTQALSAECRMAYHWARTRHDFASGTLHSFMTAQCLNTGCVSHLDPGLAWVFSHLCWWASHDKIRGKSSHVLLNSWSVQEGLLCMCLGCHTKRWDGGLVPLTHEQHIQYPTERLFCTSVVQQTKRTEFTLFA